MRIHILFYCIPIILQAGVPIKRNCKAFRKSNSILKQMTAIVTQTNCRNVTLNFSVHRHLNLITVAPKPLLIKNNDDISVHSQ